MGFACIYRANYEKKNDFCKKNAQILENDL